jgi:hypothetical protein
VSDNPHVVLVKLKFMRSLVQDALFDRTESRKTLLPSVLDTLKQNMATDSQGHSLSILGDVMTKLQVGSATHLIFYLFASRRSPFLVSFIHSTS